MPWCDLQLDESRTKVTCKVCGEPFPVTIDELKLFKYDLSRFSQSCRGGIYDEKLAIAPEPPVMPPLYRRAWNFIKAWCKHTLKGNPRVSERKMRKRLAICKSCPSNMYYDGYCLHGSCGCPINDRNTYLSKLWWRDGKCPLNYW